MSYIFEHFVGPFAALMVISGICAFFSNGVVFTLLIKKQDRLLSCECLVALKCVLSAFYGIVLMIPGLSYFLSANSLLHRLKENLTVHCLVHFAFYNFIIIIIYILLKTRNYKRV